jgi:catechol 2,3-dioxygenase-like lactoylglutathione lyase family enzyme
MTPPLRGIRHVALFTSDLEASERFWIDIMGYLVEWRPDADNLYLTCGADNLALHRRPAAAPPAGAARGAAADLDHIGLAVPSSADVDAWAKHLKAQGLALAAEPKDHRDGSRSLYFRDPGGIMVQIIHHAPISQP